MTKQIQTVTSELMIMNRDALAGLVWLGANAGDPLKFVTDATDRFVVCQMLRQTEVEPRTASGSLD